MRLQYLLFSREPPERLRGVMEGIQRMGGRARMIYSDEERSPIGSELQGCFKEKPIESHTTTRVDILPSLKGA